ncbi:MAG: leucyl/phenylalanyl-tRNA--protein transferase [Polaribacter sp.]
MIWLSEKIEFPPYECITNNGIIALGGDLSSERLIYAYQHGIFPWFSEGEPIVWYCPEKRMVLFPEDLKITKSMRKIIQKNEFLITENKAFEEVIFNCKHIQRNDGLGTWITNDMEQAYIRLYKKGIAKSIEVWKFLDTCKKEKELVGGLYGLEINAVFCGESMFSRISNASKLAFFYLVKNKNYQLIDCQIYSEHLASLGAKEIKRNEFLEILKKVKHPF